MSLMQDTLYNMVAWFVGSRSSIAIQPGRTGKDGEGRGAQSSPETVFGSAAC